MTTAAVSAPTFAHIGRSSRAVWAGRVVSAIPSLFLLVDALGKVIGIEPAVETERPASSPGAASEATSPSASPALVVEGVTKRFIVGRKKRPVVAIANVSVGSKGIGSHASASMRAAGIGGCRRSSRNSSSAGRFPNASMVTHALSFQTRPQMALSAASW